MNLIMIALDTLRTDHLGCYGYRRGTSPALDLFAEQGVLFERYFATTVPTQPSFTTVFTGMDAFGHQVVNSRGDHEPSREIPMLAEVLRDAGYQTSAVDTMCQWMSRGFDRYVGAQVYDFYKEPEELDETTGLLRREKHFGAAMTRTALESLDSLSSERPFFFFCHYWDPHQPYAPPSPYRELYYKGDPRDPRHTSMRKPFALQAKRPWLTRFMDESVTDAEYWVAQYDAEINYVDDQVRALLEAVKQKGLWDDTLVVILADHGEILNEHSGEFDHEGLYDANVHVPLLMRLPGDKFAGKRVEAMTSNLDVMPTILELLGIKEPGTVEGESLMPLVRGEEQTFRKELFLGEATWQCKRGVRTEEWKFIRALSDEPRHNWRGSPLREMYFLPDDPAEQTNLINVRPRVAAELERRLDAYLSACEKRYGHGDPIAAQGTSFGRKAMAVSAEQDREDFEIR